MLLEFQMEMSSLRRAYVLVDEVSGGGAVAASRCLMIRFQAEANWLRRC